MKWRGQDVTVPDGYTEEHVRKLLQLIGNFERSCYSWEGKKDRNGYPVMSVRGRTVGARRVLWNLLNGEIRKDLRVVPTCHNKGCMNPQHHRPMSIRGMMNESPHKGKKEFCKKGHPFSPENTRWRRSPRKVNKDGSIPMWRVCIICARESAKNSRRKGGNNPKNE